MTYDEYNKFVLENLVNYFDTDFVLTIQDDGFIINQNKWDCKFLSFDYIGAPWPISWPGCDINNVGNGGFSLRSKKFTQYTRDLCEFIPGNGEDELACRKYFHVMKAWGINFADEKTASEFSVEHVINVPSIEGTSQVANNIDTLNSFGFHFVKSREIEKIK
jgi:hypothetical protein